MRYRKFVTPVLTKEQEEEKAKDTQIYNELCRLYPLREWNPHYPYTNYGGKQAAIDGYYKGSVEKTGPIGFAWTR